MRSIFTLTRLRARFDTLARQRARLDSHESSFQLLLTSAVAPFDMSGIVRKSEAQFGSNRA